MILQILNEETKLNRDTVRKKFYVFLGGGLLAPHTPSPGGLAPWTPLHSPRTLVMPHINMYHKKGDT